MTSTQKIIKYSAIALALFLTFTIIYSIFNIFYSIFESTNIITKHSNEKIEYKYNDYDNNIKYLDIDLGSTNLNIIKSDKLSLKYDSNSIDINEKDNILKIEEKKKIYFNTKKLKELILYIPDNIEFEKVNINTGAGILNIEDLLVTNLNLSLGAGETTIKNITSNHSKIDTGAGNVNIINSNLNNLNLNLGVGEIEIQGNVTGNSKIDCGIGEVTLNLNDYEENYTFEIDKGIGEIKLNNNSISKNTTINNGINYIKINGGIGEINIKTN